MEKVKLFLIDNDLIWMKVISNFLKKEDDFWVVGTASNREDAISFIKSSDIDIVLLDINFGNNKYNGIDLVKSILDTRNIKIFILSSTQDRDSITNAFAAGAVNYLYKEDYEFLPYAIRAVYRNVPPIEVLGREYSDLRKDYEKYSCLKSENCVLRSTSKRTFRREIERMFIVTYCRLKAFYLNITKRF
jgi:NarL family two-component system response regulator LiaR